MTDGPLTTSALLGGAAPQQSSEPAAPGPAPAPLPLPQGVVQSDELHAGKPAPAPDGAATPPGLPLPLGIVQGDELVADGAAVEASAIEANPHVTVAQLHTHLLGAAGVDPIIARHYVGKLRQALAQPAPTAEQLRTGHDEAAASMRQIYGEHAEKVAEAARLEMRDMARGFPELPGLLERTGLGNDVSVIRAFAGRAYDKWRASSGLPPRD